MQYGRDECYNSSDNPMFSHVLFPVISAPSPSEQLENPSLQQSEDDRLAEIEKLNKKLQQYREIIRDQEELIQVI